MALYEFIHTFVESLDILFGKVTELDIMLNLDRAYMLLDEMIMNGCIVDTNRKNCFKSVNLMEKVLEKSAK